MIPVVEQRDVVSSGADDSTSFDISKDDVAHIMTILRDTLYSDKILAVLREYGTNAWDANRMAGRVDVPIEVTLPTLGNPELAIRDHGPGLSHEDIRKVYTQYGASTKRETNVAAGMLGIGSKSGFAYSDSFTITSWHLDDPESNLEGPPAATKRIYVAVLNDEKGRCDLIHSESCSPDEVGVEIRLAVRPQDIGQFEEKAKVLFSYFDPQPRINTTLQGPFVGRRVKDLGWIKEDGGYDWRGKWIVTMGPVAYRVDMSQLTGMLPGGVQVADAAFRSMGGLLPFDIGNLQVQASREGLKYGDSTREQLARRINSIIDEYVAELLTGIDDVSGWERRQRVMALRAHYLPIPARFKDYKHYVPLTANQSVGYTAKNYKGHLKATNALQVSKTSRLVIRDEKRAAAGYKLTDNDVVVSASPLGAFEKSPHAMRSFVLSMVKDLDIEGVTVVMLSKVGWEPPKRSDGKTPKARDNERAQARAFMFDPSVVYSDENRALSWQPISRKELDTDVFVILESYRVRDYDGFYVQFRNDMKVVKDLGLSMPPVYGYKSTPTRRVSADSKKGQEYSEWRKDGLLKLLLKNKDVARVVQLIPYDGYGFHSVPAPKALESELGADHMLTVFADKCRSGRMDLARTSEDIKSAAAQAKSLMKDVDMEPYRLRQQIYARYPLLQAEGIYQLTGSWAKAWLDYVRMVDLVTPITNSENKEAA